MGSWFEPVVVNIIATLLDATKFFLNHFYECLFFEWIHEWTSRHSGIEMSQPSQHTHKIIWQRMNVIVHTHTWKCNVTTNISTQNKNKIDPANFVKWKPIGFRKMKLRNCIRIIKTNNKNVRTYFVLAIVRVLLVFIPQFGYIHPDEFFQSMEVMAGKELLSEAV